MGKIHAKLRPAAPELPKFASILIVDDQRFDRARLIRLIEGLDIETHVVQADCLETMGAKLNSDKFDLIFVDYNLPDGTGLQALDAIQLDPSNRQAATIMITGDGQSDIAIQALKRGCSDYLTKDELSPHSFERATINALQKSRLSIGIETQDTKRQQMEHVLEKFSTECANEIKPVVSRMMRQLRDLREFQSQSPEQLAERYNRIENSCMRLWEFLDDLGRYQGTDIAQEIVANRQVLRRTSTATEPQNNGRGIVGAQDSPPDPRPVRASPAKPLRKPSKPSLFGKTKK